MDTGHYNCRDYHITPHFAPTTIATDINGVSSNGRNDESGESHARSPFHRSTFARHESFDELEQRSRSPASFKPRFPLLRLPLELRQHIFTYLLPRTIEHADPNPLAIHARNFSAVKKRAARGMIIPKSTDPAQKGPSNVVWQRGNVILLRVCRQVHDECADMLYGNNTFQLFITYLGITFRYSWLLPSGLAPNRRFNFLDLLAPRYMTRIKRLVVNVDHVDSYTSMIKFNVSGKGLTHGLRKQVHRLVNALLSRTSEDKISQDSCDEGESNCLDEKRRLAKIAIRVSNGNAFLDQIKSEVVRQREGTIRVSEDIQEMLEPFAALHGVREVAISGAVTERYARDLEQKMKNVGQPDDWATIASNMADLDLAPSPQLCVYGNDL